MGSVQKHDDAQPHKLCHEKSLGAGARDPIPLRSPIIAGSADAVVTPLLTPY